MYYYCRLLRLGKYRVISYATEHNVWLNQFVIISRRLTGIRDEYSIYSNLAFTVTPFPIPIQIDDRLSQKHSHTGLNLVHTFAWVCVC